MWQTFQIPISWPELFKRTLKEFNDDNCLGLGGQLAYFLLLALAPAIVFLLALTSFLPSASLQEALNSARAFMPQDVVTILEDQLKSIATGESGGLLTFGFLFALWSSSAAVVAMTNALNRAYDIEEGRSWWKVRLTAILLTIALAVSVLLAFALVLLGPTLAEWLAVHVGLGPVFEWTWKILQWPLVFVLVVVAIGLLNYFGPDAEQEWAWVTPGAVLATVLWLVASLGFKFYVANFANYNETYGSLGGVVVLMLWFYISSLAVLMGAEMNAEIEHASPHGKDAGEKVPGQKKKLGAAAAREYEARQKAGGPPASVRHSRGPAGGDRLAAPARTPGGAPVHAFGASGGSVASRVLGLPVFLALWVRRRKNRS